MISRALFQLIVLIMLLAPPWCQAQDSPFSTFGKGLPLIRSSVLPVEEAFALNTFIQAPDTIVLQWTIRKDYYLYRKSLGVMDDRGNSITLEALPEPVMMEDEFFGDVDVYFDSLTLKLPVSSVPHENGQFNFSVLSQGCAKDLYCYPPQEQMIELSMPEQE